MARKTVSMEVKLAIEAFSLIGDLSMTVREFCDEQGISPDTYYRYRARLREEGLEGLVPRSRAPHTHPNQTPAAVEELLVAKHDHLVGEGLDAGAISVRNWLEEEGHCGLPSARTIHKILRKHGRVEASPQKRPHASYRNFVAVAPNLMWQIDATDWPLADGSPAVIIRVIDDHSRKSLASLAAPGETFVALWACTEKAMQDHGLPVQMLSDNGAGLSARRRHGGAYSQYEIRLAQLGIAHITSSSMHPQTCGKKEREWKTQKKWLAARPRAQDLDELQRQLDIYDLMFNTQRRHQGIGNITPDQRYNATEKVGPDPNQPVSSRTQIHTTLVYAGGRIRIDGHDVALGYAWAGATVQYLVTGDHAVVFSGPTLIRRLKIDRSRRYQPLPGRGLKPKTPLPSDH
jgi:transposase InsO family protein